ncbi:unnamed protein product [Phytophthora lilii]|uniref:Unnamed protein product n=1 Tax=Phytophthora lilii TaxID=2077276 RepID=A0A9W6WMR1_9STRA|nr:unnamed protein product [Phytophthora lilii]
MGEQFSGLPQLSSHVEGIKHNTQFPIVQNTEERLPPVTEVPNEPLVKKPVVTFQTPVVSSWLPEFEWTDEDEMTLERLENGEDIPLQSNNVDSVVSAASDTTSVSAPSTTTTINEQKARDRLESRKKLEALLSASLKSASAGALRKPRWRLETEGESDEVSPFEPSDDEVMEPLQIFRSAVIAIMYTVQLKNMLMAKRIAEKESAMRDFEAMLRVYFDATRMWLGKVVRTPLLSVLQDSALDVDISTRGILAESGLRGFAKKFGGFLARRPPSPATESSRLGLSVGSAIDAAKLLKLKVRMKGILLALDKAIDKKEVPSGILDFWKRISSDGIYFPPSYQVFDEERQSLEFDDLGATRNMDFDEPDYIENRRGDNLTSSGFSRFNIVVINFLLVRILIPHVILQPWNVGIGPKNVGKQASANLANLATLLYCVCRQLSPLPSPIEPPEASFSGRRRSKTIAASQPDTADKRPETDESFSQATTHEHVISSAASGPELQGEEHTSFLSIDEIGLRLISDKNFPTNDSQVLQVTKEHQSILQGILTKLRSRLYSSHREVVAEQADVEQNIPFKINRTR